MPLKVSQNSQENSCAEVSFSCNFNKNEAVAQALKFVWRPTKVPGLRSHFLDVRKILAYITCWTHFMYPFIFSMDWIRRFSIQSEYKKIRTRKTPNTNTFHAVSILHLLAVNYINSWHLLCKTFSIAIASFK